MSNLADLNMVDLAEAVWRKSSYTANNGNCVEVADKVPGVDGIFIRDSKNTRLPVIRACTSLWAAFVTAVANDSLTP
jgi:hypothetical protein